MRGLPAVTIYTRAETVLVYREAKIDRCRCAREKEYGFCASARQNFLLAFIKRMPSTVTLYASVSRAIKRQCSHLLFIVFRPREKRYRVFTLVFHRRNDPKPNGVLYLHSAPFSFPFYFISLCLSLSLFLSLARPRRSTILGASLWNGSRGYYRALGGRARSIRSVAAKLWNAEADYSRTFPTGFAFGIAFVGWHRVALESRLNGSELFPSYSRVIAE